jgi:hypothetical protein
MIGTPSLHSAGMDLHGPENVVFRCWTSARQILLHLLVALKLHM